MRSGTEATRSFSLPLCPEQFKAATWGRVFSLKAEPSGGGGELTTWVPGSKALFGPHQ